MFLCDGIFVLIDEVFVHVLDHELVLIETG
jgi:hypothetical protein